MALRQLATYGRWPTFAAVPPTIVVAIAAAVGYAILGSQPIGETLFVTAAAACAATVFLSLRRYRPLVPRAWVAIGLALACLTAADLLVVIGRGAGQAFLGELAQVFFFAAYAPLFVAAFRFGRLTHRSDATAFLDAGIVGLAMGPLAWELLIEPNLPQGSVGPMALMALATPIVDVALISLVAPLIILRTARSSSALLLVAGLALLAVGDAAYAVGTLGGTPAAAQWVNLAWLGSYIALATASAVPSARSLGTARDPRSGIVDGGRLVVLSLAIVGVPLVTVAEALRSGEDELLLFSAIALSVALLLAVRLRRTVHQATETDRRFRRFLERPGFLAAMKDPDGRYLYANPGTQEARGIPADGWYGMSDEELLPADLAEEIRREDTRVQQYGADLTELIERDGRVWEASRFPLPGLPGGVGVIGMEVTDRRRAEEAVRFQARLLESVRDVVIVVDANRHVTYWNQGAEEILGYSRQGMLGRSLNTLIASRAPEAEALWDAIERGDVDSLEWEGTRRDGQPVWLNVRVSALSGPDGSLAGYLGVGKDMTARKASELQLARLATAIGNATDAVVVTDGHDHVAYVNPAFERLTGTLSADIFGMPLREVPGGRALVVVLAEARQSVGEWRGDIVGVRLDGTDLVCETSISRIEHGDPQSAGFVIIQRDVTAERAAELTAKRRARERSLIAETLSALRAGQAPETTADAVCRQVLKLPRLALAAVVTFGVTDAVVIGQRHRRGRARPGVVLPDSRSTHLRERARAGPWIERWETQPEHPYQELISRLGIVAHAYAPIVVGGSPIGVLIAGTDDPTGPDALTEQLPALAEFAAITGTLLAGQVADRVAADTARASIRRIIERGGFDMRFQPIVELATGKIRGYEALTRFADGTPPDVRFELAHQLGVALELEAACLRAAFDAAALLPHDAWLNVNVSPELILAGIVEPLLPAGDRDIVLEITEHQAITDYVTFRNAVEPLRGRIRLAVDDAGAGFASLRHIVELAPAIVKLDRSLIQGIADDGARQAVVSGMVRFVGSAGLTLIAEGIEIEPELTVLRRLGVTLGQGYLLGMPAPLGNLGAVELPSESRPVAPAPVAWPEGSARI